MNTLISDRWQLSTNVGTKYTKTDIGDQNVSNWTHLVGGETRFDVTEKIDIGLRGSFLTNNDVGTSYAWGPSIGVSPVKNVWISAGYNVQGYRDDDFEAAEYSRKGAYLQFRLKFDQNTASGLLRRLSPSANTLGPVENRQILSAPKAPETPQVAAIAPVQSIHKLAALEPSREDEIVEFDKAADVIELADVIVAEKAPVEIFEAANDVSHEPVEPIVQLKNLNQCGRSPIAIFDVPLDSEPKQLSRLGTLPQFGDSQDLTPSEFYEKLNTRYLESATDKAYLNHLFVSMGYSNGWLDAQPYMFTEETLPVGTRGLMGFGQPHHYSFSVLPVAESDRKAFRIRSANGVVVHFMKTCGNYMYACE